MTECNFVEDLFDVSFKEYDCLPKQSQDAIVRGLLAEIISPMDARGILEDAQYCQSPIEKIFLVAYEIVTIHLCYQDFLILNIQDPIKCGDKKYIADFVFDTELYLRDFYTPEHDLRLVIECDGHKYHNSTKQQVAHDNERDFDLKMEGYEILHFSGSQIVRNPWKCAEEAIDFILTRIGELSEGGDVDKWEKEHGNVS